MLFVMMMCVCVWSSWPVFVGPVCGFKEAPSSTTLCGKKRTIEIHRRVQTQTSSLYCLHPVV
jgi:hypothetical protein